MFYCVIFLFLSTLFVLSIFISSPRPEPDPQRSGPIHNCMATLGFQSRARPTFINCMPTAQQTRPCTSSSSIHLHHPPSSQLHHLLHRRILYEDNPHLLTCIVRKLRALSAGHFPMQTQPLFSSPALALAGFPLSPLCHAPTSRNQASDVTHPSTMHVQVNC